MGYVRTALKVIGGVAAAGGLICLLKSFPEPHPDESIMLYNKTKEGAYKIMVIKGRKGMYLDFDRDGKFIERGEEFPFLVGTIVSLPPLRQIIQSKETNASEDAVLTEILEQAREYQAALD